MIIVAVGDYPFDIKISLYSAGLGKMPDYEIVFTDFLAALAMKKSQKLTRRVDSSDIC